MHHLNVGNEIPYYKEIHALLLEWSVTFLRCIRMIGRASDSMYVFIMFDIICHFCQKWLSTFMKKLNALHPLITGNGIPWYKERQQLLIKYWSSVSQPPLNVWGWLDVLLVALKSPLWSTPCQFCQKQLLKIKQNNTFWQLLSMGNRMPCYMEIHLLLLECFITLPSCIMMTLRSFDSIWELFMLKIMSFLPTIALKFWAKYQILGTLSTWEMGCRDI